MKIGVMNNPRNSLLEEIKWIAENGFDFIDLTIEPPGAYDIDIKETKKLLDYFNLSVIGHTNPFLPFIFPIEEIRRVCLKEFRKYINIFSELGITLVNIHPTYYGPSFSDDDKIRENINFLKKINELCRKNGVSLMVENFLKPFDSPETFEKILEEVPGLNVHLDIGHCNINHPENLTENFFKIFGHKIVHLHFSDNKGERDDHLPLGCGNIDWKNIVKILKDFGYDSTITLEIFSPDRDYLLMSRDKLLRWLR